MQAPPQSVYANILNQAQELDQANQFQSDPGRRNLELAAEAIRSAREIVLVAVGASYSACFPFVNRMAGAERQVRLEDAAEFIYYIHRAYDSQVVFLQISRSGETIEIVKALQTLKSLGRQVIGITNEAGSTLAQFSDIPLIIGGPTDYLISIQTYLTSLLTLHHLAEYVSGTPQAAAYRIGMQGLIGLGQATLDRYQDASLDWKEKFIPYQAVYLSGRGHSLASAHQGSLLFHEIARFPGVAFNAGAFRHGPWEALDERMLAFVFAPVDDTYDLNINLLLILCALGSRVVLVSGQLSQSKRIELEKLDRLEIWDIPTSPVDFAPFLEILTLEFFIYEFACWQGLTPGVFRACTTITLAETGSLATRQLKGSVWKTWSHR